MGIVPWSRAETAIIYAHADRGVLACLQALDDAGYDRSEQSVKAKRQRLGGCEAKSVWTPAQVEWLELHWREPATALVAAINRLGPERSWRMIADKRRKMGIGQPCQPRDTGWPKVATDPRDQDRNYLRALLADLRQMKLCTDSSPDVYPVHGLAPCETAHNASMKMEIA